MTWKWAKPGFDTIDPKQFFLGVCSKCGFTGELDDADFRTSGSNADAYKKDFSDQAIQALLSASSTGKGITQSLIKRLEDNSPLASLLVKLHLGIYSQAMRSKVTPGAIARYYLRVAWAFRDKETFYRDEEIGPFLENLSKLRPRWKRELPEQNDYPAQPRLALDEANALRLSRTFFERNYETLRSAGPEDELKLRYLLAEIGFRLYELSEDADDYKKAASFFSGTMQQCLGIISDKTIVGGMVNRAREMLEIVGERGRELRALHKSRGGVDESDDNADLADGKKKKKKKKKKKTAGVKTSVDGEKSQKTPRTGSNGSDQDPADRDKSTRTLSLLQEELDTLKSRVADLQADNKKWRQLIGRDPLTGLPNKVTLFRINLPKILRNFDGGPFTCIAIGLDQVAKVNQEHGWLMGDRMLKESAKGLSKFLQDGEELYRMDGANFVLAGNMNGNLARQRASEMRRTLGGATVKVEDTSLPMASSLGVVTVEQMAGSAPETANAVYEALIKTLYRAKEKGGNTAEVHNTTRF